MTPLKALAIAVPVALGLIDCGHSLAGPADVKARAVQPARSGRVYMFRGLFGTARSLALDEIAAELKGRGVTVSVHDHSDWGAAAESIKAQYRAQPGPIVLVGYSMGGYSAIRLSRELGTAGIPVDLLITLDPAFPPPIPANVAQAVDLYQTRAGFPGSPVQADSGFRGALVVRDLSRVPGAEHRNFPTLPEVRREVVARVLQAVRGEPSRPRAAPRQAWRR